MDQKIQALTQYFSTNGTLADALAFSQMVASQTWGEVSKLYNIILGSV